MATTSDVGGRVRRGSEPEELDLDSDVADTLPSERVNTLAVRRTPQIADHASNRIVVGTGISSAAFSEMYPDTTSFSWYNGWIILEELPLKGPHGYATNNFTIQAGAIPGIEGAGDMSLSTPLWTMQPDTSFIPVGTPNPGPGHVNAATLGGLPWPTLIFEVHYQRSLADLATRMNQWLSPATRVQVGIAIKIYKRTAGIIPMVAFRFERGMANPVYCVSFGTKALRSQSVAAINGYGGAAVIGVGAGGVACSAPNMPAYQLHIPTALLFNNAPPPLAPAFYTIDLFPLQQVIIRRYE